MVLENANALIDEAQVHANKLLETAGNVAQDSAKSLLAEIRILQAAFKGV